MKSRALDFWKSFDLFGVAPTLSYQGGGKSKTVYGTIFSYVMVCWLIMALIFSFESMILRKNPNTFTSTIEGRDSGVPFGKDSLHIGFALLDGATGQYVIDPSIVNPVIVKTVIPKADQNGQIIRPPSTQITIPKACSLDHFNGQFSATGFCLDANTQETLGTVENEVLTFQLLKCSNQTSPIPCKAQSVIDQVFNDCSFLITYPGYYVEPGNFDNPIKIKREFKYMSASATMSKSMQIFLQEYELQTDSGFILPDVETKNYVRVQSTVVDGTMDGKNLISALIQMTGDKVIQRRSYMKIQQSLAGTVALTRVGFLLCAFLLIPCTKVKYNQNLIYDLFSLKDSTNKICPSSFNLNEDGKKQAIQGPVQLNFEDDKSLNNSTQIDFRKGSSSMDSSLLMAQKLGSNKQSQFSKTQLKPKQSDILENSSCQGGGMLSPALSEVALSSKQILPKSFDYNTENENGSSNRQGERYDNDKNSDEDQDQAQSINIGTHSPIKQKAQQLFQQKSIDSLLQLNKEQSISIPNQSKVQLNQPELKPSNPPNKFKDPVVFAWFRSTFSCLANKESNKLKIGAKKISKELCAFRLIEKMREIDRLKMLLLNEEQRVIFDNLPKPVLMAPSESENNLQKAQREGNVSNQNDLQNYYQSLANKSNKSVVDSKLLNWFESGQYCSQ